MVGGSMMMGCNLPETRPAKINKNQTPPDKYKVPISFKSLTLLTPWASNVHGYKIHENKKKTKRFESKLLKMHLRVQFIWFETVLINKNFDIPKV